MGGYGSTRWGWHSKQPALDACPRITIPFLRSQNLLNRHLGMGSRSVTWSRNGQETGSCVVSVNEAHDTLTVYYSHRAGDAAPWVPVSHAVPLIRTPCHYGGHRVWFACPRCGRRCEVLVVAGAVVGCRVCLRLPYSSQREQPHQRILNRIQKMEKIAPHGIRPRGMWRRTWARYCRKFNALQEADTAAMMARFGHLL